MSDGVERLGRRNVRHLGNPFRNLGHCAWFQCWSQSAIMTVAKHSLAGAFPGGHAATHRRGLEHCLTVSGNRADPIAAGGGLRLR